MIIISILLVFVLVICFLMYAFCKVASSAETITVECPVCKHDAIGYYLCGNEQKSGYRIVCPHCKHTENMIQNHNGEEEND